MSQRYIIPSLDRAIEVLGLLARSKEGLTLADIARATDIPKSTLFRILTTLQHHQCVQWREDERCFRVGHYLWQLGSGFLDQCEPYRASEQHMKRLSEATGETALLARLQDDLVLYLRRVDGTNTVALMRNLGESTPIFCTASGRAILAFLPPNESDALLARQSLQRYTDKTVTDLASLQKSLAQVRRQGYCIIDGEYNEEVLFISAPVLDHSARPCAAVTLAMLSSRRAQPGFVQRCALLVRESADAFSQDMGYHGQRVAA
ncbi:MAG TPA: IclR family transcriptional regulator [Rhodothermales bacterium]|nr:IclR family transcriptional regulator [Rhodothermales bacterium]